MILKLKLMAKGCQHQNLLKSVLIDSHLNWSHHADSLSTKLSRAIGMLSKIRQYVSEITLRSIYFGIFSSLLTYGAEIWAQFSNKHVSRLQRLQNKAIRRINFAKPDHPSSPLYQKSQILKLTDHVRLKNFLFVHNLIKGTLLQP